MISSVLLLICTSSSNTSNHSSYSDAAASASRSSLHRPLPSPFPTDLFLYLQQLDHHEDPASAAMVRKRLPPDVDLPPPRQPVTGGLSATMTAATGGSAGPVGVLLFPVSGTAQQRRKQRDEGALLMLTLPPLQCAESVYFHDPDEAESVLLAIAELAITLGTSRQLVASYLAEAMSARIFSSCLGLYAPLLHALRHGGMPRISASMESLEITRKRLSNLVLDRSFEFEFCPVANKVGNLDPEKLVVDTWRREVVALHWLRYSLYDSNTLCIIRRYMFDNEPVKEDETKQVLAKQYGDGGEKELFHINPGLNTTPLSLPESPEENTTCNLHDKGKYQPPKVWLKKENRENKKRKPEAHFFSALKGESSSKVLCPKSDATSFLLPRHAKVCPKVDISTIQLTHSKRGVPPTPASSSQEREESCPGRCVALVFVASVAGCVGPWISIYSLEPIHGKVHKFIFFIRIEPIRMWYLTLAVSINYYVSMVSSGVMVESNQRCGILVPNIAPCFIFLLLVAYLFYREKTAFQVTNAVSVKTSLYCILGAILIGLLHTVCGLRHPGNFREIFYFEKIALACLTVMYAFRWFTMDNQLRKSGLTFINENILRCPRGVNQAIGVSLGEQGIS